MSYEMPMPSVYFYDITKSPAYEITFAIMCYATYCTALINVSKTHDILDEFKKKNILKNCIKHVMKISKQRESCW